MRFRGKLSEADLDDVRRLVRTKLYWPKLILANWYGVLLLGAVIWATVEGIVGNTRPNWTAIAVIWGVILAIAAWSFYRAKRSLAMEFQNLSAGLPDWLTLDDNGVKSDGPNGATAFRPWQNFKGWREGRRVILLDLETGAFLILLIDERSEAERESIRQFLVLHIQFHIGAEAIAK
jgi:hypothetical protein